MIILYAHHSREQDYEAILMTFICILWLAEYPESQNEYSLRLCNKLQYLNDFM